MKRRITWMACMTMIVAVMLSFIGAQAESAAGLSLTTGLTTDHGYQALAVLFDNSAAARPQINMAKADVIYEMQVERGGQTRYAAIFQDEIPEGVEAVGSAHIMHVDVSLDWSAAMVHFGGQNNAGNSVYDYLKAVAIPCFDGMIDTKDFCRDTTRAMPGNVVARLQQIYASHTAPDAFSVHTPLRFSADQPTIKGNQVTVFRIPYGVDQGYYPSYEYLPAQGVYQRYYNREDFLDGGSGEAYTFSNVIVMYADYSWYDDAVDKPIVALTGSNRCEYFIGGKHFSGTWSRASVNESTAYMDADGNEVLFKPGKTFIQLVMPSVEIEYVR